MKLCQNFVKKGMTFNEIADHINKENTLSARVKTLRGGYVHSIIKRKKVRDEKLKERYSEVRSDFYLDIYDNSIILNL